MKAPPPRFPLPPDVESRNRQRRLSTAIGCAAAVPIFGLFLLIGLAAPNFSGLVFMAFFGLWGWFSVGPRCPADRLAARLDAWLSSPAQ